MNRVSGLFIIVVAILVVVGSCAMPTPTATPQVISPLYVVQPTPHVPGNLVINPSFEGEFVNCGQSCNVAPGWTAWTAEGNPPPCVAGQPGCYIPCPSNCSNCKVDFGCWWAKAEHKAAMQWQFPERVHSGESAQQAFTFGRMGEFGVWQNIANIPIGARVEFAIYAQAWQCYEAPNNCQPDRMNLKVGIDPLGGSDPYNSNIVWSDTIESFDQYTRLSVEAIAQKSTVTIFTYARPEWDWARRNNDAYWDDASLVMLVEPTPTPTPQPSAYRIELPILFRNYRPFVPADISAIRVGGYVTFTSGLTNAGEIEILAYFPQTATLMGGAALSEHGYFVGGLYNNIPYGYLYFDDADAAPGPLFWAQLDQRAQLKVYWFWVERVADDPAGVGGPWHSGLLILD